MWADLGRTDSMDMGVDSRTGSMVGGGRFKRCIFLDRDKIKRDFLTSEHSTIQTRRRRDPEAVSESSAAHQNWALSDEICVSALRVCLAGKWVM